MFTQNRLEKFLLKILLILIQFISLPMSTHVDEDVTTSNAAVGIDRNHAAKAAERSGRQRRMSKLLPHGSGQRPS